MPGAPSSPPDLNGTTETITLDGNGDMSNINPDNTNTKSTEQGDGGKVNGDVTSLLNGTGEAEESVSNIPDTSHTEGSNHKDKLDNNTIPATDGPNEALPEKSTNYAEDDDLPPPPPPPPALIEDDTLPPPPPPPPGKHATVEAQSVVVNVDDANFTPDETVVTNIDEVLDNQDAEDEGGRLAAPSQLTDFSASVKVVMLTSYTAKLLELKTFNRAGLSY